MIRVRLAPFRVQADGHAGFDEPGRDIVCAAVSALLQALALGLARLERYGHITDTAILLDEGEAVLTATPTQGHQQAARLLFDVFGEALLRLAEEYSEYIEVRSYGFDPV